MRKSAVQSRHWVVLFFGVQFCSGPHCGGCHFFVCWTGRKGGGCCGMSTVILLPWTPRDVPTLSSSWDNNKTHASMYASGYYDQRWAMN
ncbi:hypothetical protein B0T18DRAFT_410303 [Schizothecium vesticola]|uniref:Secreted protein n=1 Tax=Schizothecium vesticola TaxID=314040 RepID=A0AA40K4R0_9PEZI|nr:hypothetical protein B0T18DRAFT_410303 [Schizothecium vesticola]